MLNKQYFYTMFAFLFACSTSRALGTEHNEMQGTMEITIVTYPRLSPMIEALEIPQIPYHTCIPEELESAELLLEPVPEPLLEPMLKLLPYVGRDIDSLYITPTPNSSSDRAQRESMSNPSSTSDIALQQRNRAQQE